MSKEFKAFIKKKRLESFPGTFDIVHATFLNLGLDEKDSDYFFDNASEVVETLREQNWESILRVEKIFNVQIYQSLIRDDVESLNPRAAVEDFIEQNVNNFYTVSLSNTQSRRSRAGGEFEAIISHLFMGADLPFDEQGLIGTGIFADSNLAKLVDHVVPGATEYQINKRGTIAISAKTTLRERWQQIGDEMHRTRMPEMYLATIDQTISQNTLAQLRNNNIYPVTTQRIKRDFYSSNNLVLTFEELLSIGKAKTKQWKIDDFSEEQINEHIEKLNRSKERHQDKYYVLNYLNRRLDFFNTKTK